MGAVLLLACAAAGAAPTPVLAEGACTAEAEPNDQPIGLTYPSGDICVTGTLEGTDQDLLGWEVQAADATSRWTMTLSGIEDAVTSLSVLPVTSEPGIDPPTVATTHIVREGSPGATDVARSDVLLPVGRYVLGIARSATAGAIEAPSTDYRVSIVRGAPLPPTGDAEPNDDPATATPLTGAFGIGGDISGTSDQYRWSAPGDASSGLWELSLQVPVGITTGLTVTSSDGSRSTSVTTVDGSATIFDLTPDPAGYLVLLGQPATGPTPYLLQASQEAPSADHDAEPNDRLEWALPMEAGRPIAKGRLATLDDVDTWRLPVDAAMSARELDIRVLSRSALPRTLCLYGSASSAAIQCRTGDHGAVLSNLLLPAGEYIVEVTGAADPGAGYILRADSTSPPVDDFEIEPNDGPQLASPFDARLVMRGRAAAGDVDVFAMTVTGEPQLWRIDAAGSGIDALEWITGDGTTLATGQVTDTRDAATLQDLYLVPGIHRISLQAEGGDYTLTATPLGPPDPGAEREPNDDEVRAGRLRLGDTRTGRLRASDVDAYRFSLAATEHVGIDVEPPADGAIVVSLESGGQRLAQSRGAGVGQPFRYEGLLPAGEYVVWLRPNQPSEQPYELRLRRLDPLATAGDLEPDDTAGTARPVPADGIVHGTGWGGGDVDFFQLPPGGGGAFAVSVAGVVTYVDLVQGDTDVQLVKEVGSDVWRTDAAPDGERVLEVTATGDYTLTLPDASPVQAGLEVTLALPTTQIAAWWPEGQHVAGTVTVRNTGNVARAVGLEARTTHHAWFARLDRPEVDLAAGASLSVPVEVTVGPDAWADTPVAIAVRATATDGTQASTFAEIVPLGDAAPVDPGQVWSLPATMLGGLDVASTALGGVPVGAIDPTGDLAIHDGLAIAGATLTVPTTVPPTPVTVDLAGEAPVPVVGTIIDPSSGLDALGAKPRGFDLLLSTDGVDFQPALSGELTPLGIDQAFALPAPVPARFARLVITSTWADSLLGVGAAPYDAILAEWKVVAAPGVEPVAAPRNIADPALGGHVVSMEPMPGADPAAFDGMITADPTRSWMAPPDTGSVRWVVGFRDDRAAQVTELDWADPAGTDPATRIRKVVLEASADSPLGPWQPLGTWKLERAGDGTVAPFRLDEPTWARFIRFTATGPGKDAFSWELPGTIAILERPTDDSYRSILGEWGQQSRSAIRELSSPPASTVVDDIPDVGEGDGAAALPEGQPALGRVALGTDADEYRLTVPEGRNSIRVTLGGEPFVGASVTLLASDGTAVPMSSRPGGMAGTVDYQANVTPGAAYRLRVEQPPFSAVFLYDTSLSIFGFWQPITAALNAFGADVEPGRDHVQLLAFDATKPVLPDWSDQPYEVQSAVEGALPVGGSSAETSMLAAMQLMQGRPGAHAILMVTDGETSSFGSGADLWRQLDAERPLVFTVQVGGSAWSTHLMQDWAASSGGAYQYVRTQDEMDRAFDRMATWLRRPAGYSMTYTTSEVTLPPPEPGRLQVVTPLSADGTPTAAPVASGTAIEIVLDTSGSMLEKIGRTTRIDAAKQVLTTLVQEDLPAGTPVALRWFRQRDRSCQTELAVPLGPLDPPSMAAVIDAVRIQRSVNTPLADAIDHVADDLGSVTGRRTVVVVSDGQENCGGDPEAAVKRLRAQGFDVVVNVVGVGLDATDRKRIRRLAGLGGGSYFDARTVDQLDTAIGAAVSAPFDVLDASGTVVATGTVNGPALELPPGTYRVVVRSDPEQVFEGVVVQEAQGATLTLAR